MYSFLKAIPASLASFAHGSNDVTNAVGPLSTLYHVWTTDTVDISEKTPVPLWVLAMGGVAIDLGLITYGYNIMRTLGNEITYHSPARGFSMELGSSSTVFTASKIGLPVSKTHCITGATAAAGLYNGSVKLALGCLVFPVLGSDPFMRRAYFRRVVFICGICA
ncbi:hypothetical protein K493DRAFT_384363 [Basidiobolus meristosporus CBS 931.73]|uniref:Phosphate transporter n=1 Tax=Basidiobolus meristosporus CBS 931.73 TaxID=1314790 RepID=A0A1Y1XSN4_9FUNG|nr:hypothetical protein K493DRAFT_384363 [Basidiobolus meristosporus CBS 931.73]|eukprot:ORX88769.1 hypothetical protein K493DRAFT_384363 [Basidiobolus meristosporus CBS 931.73]